jgi:hypothetical protein
VRYLLEEGKKSARMKNLLASYVRRCRRCERESAEIRARRGQQAEAAKTAEEGETEQPRTVLRTNLPSIRARVRALALCGVADSEEALT